MEHALFLVQAAVRGPVAQSNYATYLYLEWVDATLTLPIVPIEQQQFYIRDVMQNNPVWREIVTGVARPREAVFAMWPHVPVRPEARRSSASDLTVLEAGQRREFGQRGDVRSFQVAGFCAPEREFTWAEGPSFEFAFRVPDKSEDYLFALALTGPAFVESVTQSIYVYANGVPVGCWVLSRDIKEYYVPIPRDVLGADGDVRVACIPAHQVQPAAVNSASTDKRALTAMLSSMVLLPAQAGSAVSEFVRLAGDDSLDKLKQSTDVFGPTARVPKAFSLAVLKPNRPYSFGRDGSAAPFVVSGFSQPEPGFTWAMGPMAHLAFRIISRTNDHVLVMDISVPNFPNKLRQKVYIYANRTAIGYWECTDSRGRYEVSLPANIIGSDGEVSLVLMPLLQFEPARYGPRSADRRPLTIKFHEIAASVIATTRDELESTATAPDEGELHPSSPIEPSASVIVTAIDELESTATAPDEREMHPSLPIKPSDSVAGVGEQAK
jgi:hypothetical protein